MAVRWAGSFAWFPARDGELYKMKVRGGELCEMEAQDGELCEIVGSGRGALRD